VGRSLPACPLVVSTHARRRARQRLGLSVAQLQGLVRISPVESAGSGRWTVLVSGKKGRGEAVVVLTAGVLVVVTVLPVRWAGARRPC